MEPVISMSDSELWTRFFGTNNEEESREAIIEIGRRLRESGLTEDPSNVVVSIGGERWLGHALSEVFDCDPEYVRWLESNGPAYLRSACAWLRQTRCSSTPAPRHDTDPWNSQ